MKEYLALGSVLKMQGSETPVMVIGYDPRKDGQTYRYLCAGYPFGIYGGDAPLIMVRQEAIERVLFDAPLEGQALPAQA